VQAGKLKFVGYHRFPRNHAEVLEGEGYGFHRPCPTPTAKVVVDLHCIDAKPVDAAEPSYQDALYSVGQFLVDKPKVEVYQRPMRVGRWE
jgi:hypothetical protein